jgi:hypothetical protein
LDIYVRRCRLLAARTGWDPSRWLAGNGHHDWLTQLIEGGGEISRAVPAGADYLLIDDDQWSSGRTLLPGRRNVPFAMTGGSFAGAPSDDSHAVTILERLVSSGCRHVVLAEPATWWQSAYPGMTSWLTNASRRVSTGRFTTVYAIE